MSTELIIQWLSIQTGILSGSVLDFHSDFFIRAVIHEKVPDCIYNSNTVRLYTERNNKSNWLILSRLSSKTYVFEDKMTKY